MERTPTLQDITQVLVYVLLSVKLQGSVATHAALLHVNNNTVDNLDDLPDDNGFLATSDAFAKYNSTIGTQDVLSHDNSAIGTLDVFQINSTLAIMDALSQDNSTLTTLDVVPIESNTLATQDALIPVISTLTDTTTVDPASCDHMGSCHTGIVCGCHYYMRIDRLGRLKKDCRKMIDCSQRNITVHTLMNIPYSQFNDSILDFNMTGIKLRVEDIDSVGEYVYKNTNTTNTILYFGPLQQLPCLTKIHIIRMPWIDSSITEVHCNNRSFTDKHIEDIFFPESTEKLWLDHNKLTLRDLLEAKLQPLQRLEQVDLSFNKLTAIPRFTITKEFFSLDITYNNITSYDSATLKQYASVEDDIFIYLGNNSFECNCEAYYTNEFYTKQCDIDAKYRMFHCLMLDEITGKKKLVSLISLKAGPYWKNKCEAWVVDKNGYLYLIFTWHNLLDFCLILANVFIIYIVYDLYMAIRETRLKSVDRKATNMARRDSNKSGKSNRKESTSTMRKISKISKFSRKGSQPEAAATKSPAPRRPLIDVIACKIKKGYENVHNFIHARVFSQKVQVLVEEENGSTNDEKEAKLFREFALESMRNSQNYDTKL